MQLGTLLFEPALSRPELLAAPVRAALEALLKEVSDTVGVAPIDPTLSDTAAFCDHYHVAPAQAANCVIVEGKRAESRTLAACVILATTRADVNNLVKKQLDAEKVSFAQMEKAVSESGMEFGAITPVGLPPEWPVLVDQVVTQSDAVIIGSGIRGSKLLIP